MFYYYRQNNSGGEFVFDDAVGVGVHVIVEAVDSDHANARAAHFLDFSDGCECCGSRWEHVWHDEGCETPEIYNTPVVEYKKDKSSMYQGDHIYIHYMDGRIEKI